jgi:tetratricopeptide (TPR) repeat protein
MKFLFRFALLALLPLSLLRADDPVAKDKAPDRAKLPFEQEFSNLPAEKREEFSRLATEAKRLYDQKRIFETVDKIKAAQKVFPNHPEITTLEGACYVEFRAFDKARVCFDRANELAPGQASIVFNIAELEYVTKDWKHAEATLTKVLDMVKDQKNQTQLSRLVEFKILLCKLKLGKIEEAKKMADNHDFMDDSPYSYYAAAAIAYQEGREIDAEAELARGGRVFKDGGMISPWQDTLVEFGYIKGFFGGEEAETTPEH